jgi:hypothetical protein
MNVLTAPKQIDKELIYTDHAIQRAEQRDVPMPKYVPLDVQCIKKEYDLIRKIMAYTLNFTFNDNTYSMVVTERMQVLTVFKPHFSNKSVKQILDERQSIKKQSPRPIGYKRQSKYRHREVQNAIQQYYNYA